MSQIIANPHTSVLLDESIEALNVQAGGIYMDGTFGRGGHSAILLEQLDADAMLVGIDRDPSAIEYGANRFKDDSRVQLVHTDFAAAREEVTRQGLPEKYDGILFDLGVSSPQLDEAERGFSFMRDGPLDMRMDTSKGITAAEWLAVAEEKDIANILFHLGDEKYSRQIAAAIVERREEEPFTQTMQLVKLLEEVITRKEKHKHPATRTFLALRIHINDELGQVEAMLPEAIKMLKPGGRLAIISFHSREDRIVKRFFKDLKLGPKLPKRMPVIKEYEPPVKLIGKMIKPSVEEIKANPRARSAVLRIAERTEAEYV